jgi:hypothetical protein
VEYIGISQKDISCFHVVGTLVYFIENLSIQDKGDFYLRMPVPEKGAGFVAGKFLIAYQQWKFITAMFLQFFL